ncbi:nitrous oxide-stimulated promoter family protein [Photobacterium damselae]|uniref:nitrous oxide-stimulated promoter family protein n=1 Tax=Photobacterium damselae TaxID=38293 RepID=UPI003C6DFFB8
MIVLNNHSVRSQRELNTVKAMIRLYCKTLHRGAIVCPECESLIEYVENRVAGCRLGGEKPSCAQCICPCYQPAKRLQMLHVIKWSYPRFLWRHPLRAVRYKIDCSRGSHLCDGRNETAKIT